MMFIAGLTFFGCMPLCSILGLLSALQEVQERRFPGSSSETHFGFQVDFAKTLCEHMF